MVPGADRLATSVTATKAWLEFCPNPPMAGIANDASAGLILIGVRVLFVAKSAGVTSSDDPGLLSTAPGALDWLSAAQKIHPGDAGGDQEPPAVPVVTALSTHNVSTWMAGLTAS